MSVDKIWYGKTIMKSILITLQSTNTILTSLNDPHILSMLVTHDFTGCPFTVSEFAQVTIDGTVFLGNQPKFTFPTTTPTGRVVVTLSFPGVTVTSLTPGQTLVFVSSL